MIISIVKTRLQLSVNCRSSGDVFLSVLQNLVRFVLVVVSLTDDDSWRTQGWCPQFCPAPFQQYFAKPVCLQSVSFLCQIMLSIHNSRVTPFPHFLTSYMSYHVLKLHYRPKAFAFTNICPCLKLLWFLIFRFMLQLILLDILKFWAVLLQFHDILGERYWRKLLSHSFRSMSTPISKQMA